MRFLSSIDHNGQRSPAGILPSEGPRLMTPATLIEQELAAAQAAQHDGNHGRARVCARRAVACATEAWLARLPLPRWRGDAMAHLRQIQQDASFPLPIRQAAERSGSGARSFLRVACNRRLGIKRTLMVKRTRQHTPVKLALQKELLSTNERGDDDGGIKQATRMLLPRRLAPRLPTTTPHEIEGRYPMRLAPKGRKELH